MFNDLIERLEAAGFTVLAFADDLSVIGTKDINLERAITICNEWAKDNEMEINKKKSGILLHNKKNIAQRVNKEEKILGIPICESYKYLGVHIDHGLTFKNHLEYIREKIQKCKHMIKVMHCQKVD